MNRWQESARKISMAAQNALELIQVGRLSEAYRARYDVLYSDARYSLRRYPGGKATSSPLLLIPPLMVTAEIYDISEELSAVTALVNKDIDVWIVDFRAPEREEGGLDRTLDDHVVAVSDAIERVCKHAGRDVHLAGYSQGGMFAYQCAAYRQGKSIASVITFGSPVDIHRAVPGISDAVAERVTTAMRTAFGGPLNRVAGLPGPLTSLVFKTMAMRKELSQLSEFLSKLHDRQALEKREAKRIFLRGEGFVAWPGPAFRTFVDEFIVANRLAKGGFVIDGKTASLADIPCPILCFVGERDVLARPASVRAIHAAAPDTKIFEVAIKTGHFGLVVGQEALRRSWPAVMQWVRWQDAEGPMPDALSEGKQDAAATASEFEALGIDLAVDVMTKLAKSAWNRIEDVVENATESTDHLRYQVPRFRRIRAMQASTQVSLAHSLQTQASTIPGRTFFMWKGQAFGYQQSNSRVDEVVSALIHCGVLPTQRVGVWMGTSPHYLSVVAAINRIGAVAVLLESDMAQPILDDALEGAEVAVLVADPQHCLRARACFTGQVLVSGDGSSNHRSLCAGVIDLDEVDPAQGEMPAWYNANSGRARDLAFIIATTGRSHKACLEYVTNYRWAFLAYGTAASATLTTNDTIYCCLPLHRVAGILLSVASALVSGARLALAQAFVPDNFWSETRRYGATVVFYEGEMCRQLVDAPLLHSHARSPIRLFVGSGMRVDTWQRMTERFGPVGILELFADTQTNAVLANASGQKVGSSGGAVPGSTSIALLRYEVQEQQLMRSKSGHCVPCQPDEQGLALTEIQPEDLSRLEESRVVRSVVTPMDCWYSTETLMHKDLQGDHWIVERLEDVVRTSSGVAYCLPVEDILYGSGLVQLAAAYGVAEQAGELFFVSLVLLPDCALEAKTLDRLFAALSSQQRPHYLAVVLSMVMNDGFRLNKAVLRSAGSALRNTALQSYQYNLQSERYEEL